MKTTAVVLAGGKGRRMSMDVAKQYLPICGKPMLLYSLECFENSEYIDEIILVLPKDEIEYVKAQILAGNQLKKLKSIVEGGVERYDSVLNAMDCIKDGYVFIHDAARPFVTEEILADLSDAVKKYGACATGVPVIDTIKQTDENGIIQRTVDRSSLWQIQTPQSFSVDIIKAAYDRFLTEGSPHVTDDTMVVELFGDAKVVMVKGSYENMKVTTPMDMIVAEEIVKQRNTEN